MTSDNITYIYVLFEENDENNIRYVGKTTDLNRRYREHLADISNTHKSHWIQGLLSVGCKIIIKPVETLIDVKDGEWEHSEKFWINFYESQGCKLTNQREGGVGWNHTDATKLKCKLVNIGHHRKHTESTKKRIAETLRQRIREVGGSGKKVVTEQQVIEIRTKFATRLKTQYELANEYGVSRCCIAAITQGTNWRHVGGPITKLPSTNVVINERAKLLSDL